MRKSVLSNFQSPRSRLEKQGTAEIFLTNFKVFGNRMKPSFECLIYLLKLLIILGEIQSKSSQNFRIIKITCPNLLHGSDLLCFCFMNLLKSLRKLFVNSDIAPIDGSFWFYLAYLDTCKLKYY